MGYSRSGGWPLRLHDFHHVPWSHLIRGGTYSGPAYDENWVDFYPFEVTEGGTINWGGPVGGIPEAGTIVISVLGKAGEKIGFDITIQNERGNFETINHAPG